MRNILLALVVVFLTALASAHNVGHTDDVSSIRSHAGFVKGQSEHPIDIYAWPVSTHKPQNLAKLSYNSTHAVVKSYTPPTIPVGDEIIRVGFYHGGNKWAGVATAASNFGAGRDKKVLLHVSPHGEVYHVGFKALDAGKTGTAKDGLDVEVVPMQTGPTPHLNKPVVLTADGKVDEKVEEKTFFQKYWWVIGLFLLFQLVVGTSGKE